MTQEWSVQYTIERDANWWKSRVMSLLNAERYGFLLDRAGYASGWNAGEWLAGWGCKKLIQGNEGVLFNAWEQWHKQAKLPLFLALGYDLKNQLEDLKSENHDYAGFPAAYVLEPLIWVQSDAEALHVKCNDGVTFTEQDLEALAAYNGNPNFFEGQVEQRFNKEFYINKVNQVLAAIEEGNVYELNLCLEFFAKDAKFDSLAAFDRLMTLSPVPMAAWFRVKEHELVCASPERFVSFDGQKLLSQPIKGTRPRGSDAQDDEKMKQELLASEKEKAENVMIVDLVRNDLNRICEPGSVLVEELFGIYTFPQVHQMISTVSGKLALPEKVVEAVAKLFPMGSMTGAPKVSAMKYIDQLEENSRGLYAGAVGYHLPSGELDLNVVIRSLIYNRTNAYLSYQAGGAITIDSVPEEEWAEIESKTLAIRKLLNFKAYPQG